MAKMTLLEMTQEILSEASSDEVNSIGDTTESLQVANIIKSKTRDMLARLSIPEHSRTFQLTPSNDANKPTVMTVPDDVKFIEWVKYFDNNVVDGATQGYIYVTMVPIAQFLDLVLSYNANDDDVETFSFSVAEDPSSNYSFMFKNDKQPNYCTIIANKYVVFDSYDNTVDTTLQASKTMCFGQVSPTFRLEDDYIPELNDAQFALLMNEAKALAFYTLKQMPHQKAEQEIKRQWSSVQRNKSVNGIPTEFDRLPDFGRRAGDFRRLRYGIRK